MPTNTDPTSTSQGWTRQPAPPRIPRVTRPAPCGPAAHRGRGGRVFFPAGAGRGGFLVFAGCPTLQQPSRRRHSHFPLRIEGCIRLTRPGPYGPAAHRPGPSRNFRPIRASNVFRPEPIFVPGPGRAEKTTGQAGSRPLRARPPDLKFRATLGCIGKLFFQRLFVAWVACRAVISRWGGVTEDASASKMTTKPLVS